MDAWRFWHGDPARRVADGRVTVARPRTIQRSFAGGEMSPSMHARVDDVRYQNGYAAGTRNYQVHPNGRADRRRGLRHVNYTKHSGSKTSVLRPFTFSIDQTLQIELGEGYFRWHTFGVPLRWGTPFTIVSVDATANTIKFTAAHRLAANTAVQFIHSTGVETNLPDQLLTSTTYYVIVVDAKTIQVSATIGPGAAVDLTDAGIATSYMYRDSEVPKDYFTSRNFLEAAVNVGTDVIDLATAHNFAVADPVRFESTGTLPAPLQLATTYYVIVASASTIKVAATAADASIGTAINLTDDGSAGATHKIHRRYSPGDLAYWPGAGHGVFYCLSAVADDVAPPADTLHWYLQPREGIYEIPNPYLESEVAAVGLHQTNDIVTMTHRSHPQAELRRFDTLRWTYSAFSFAPDLAAPVATDVIEEYGEYQEFIADNGTPTLFTKTTVAGGGAADQNNGHGFLVGDAVYVESQSGGIGNSGSFSGNAAGYYEVMAIGQVAAGTPFNDLKLRTLRGGIRISTVSVNVFMRRADPLTDITHNYRVTAVTEDGLESQSSNTVSSTGNNLSVPGASNTVTWTAVAGAKLYRIYRKKNGVYGFIGKVGSDDTQSFKDENLTVQLDRTLPILDTTLGGITRDFLPAAVNTGTEVIDLGTAHNLTTGAQVKFTNRDGDSLPVASPSGLTQEVIYYAIVISASTIKVALSASDATSGIALNFTGIGTGTHTIHMDLTGYPAAVTEFDGRMTFAGTIATPDRLWATRVAARHDLSFHIPVQADDRLRLTPASNQAVSIRHLVPLKRLVVLSDSTEFQIVPVNSEVLTPDTIEARSTSYEGSSTVRPAVIAGNLLFVASRSGHLLEIGESPNGELSRPGDLCLRSDHLFDGEVPLDQSAAKAPHPIDWLCSSSGLLLGLTYVPQEQIGAWHSHDTAASGLFESVSVTAEGGEDVLYAIVKRTINGSTVRTVERMAEQRYDDLEDAYFVDAGGTFDGTNTDGVTTMTVSGGTTWAYGETVTVTASTVQFVLGSEDVGDHIAVRASQTGAYYRIRISAVSTNKIVTGTLLQALPTALRNVAVTTWAFARDTISLPWLEGQTVQVFADALVQDEKTVTSGVITLATPAIVAQVGLAFPSPLKTLPVGLQVVDAWGQGREKNVNKAWLRVVDSGAFRIGPTDAEEDLVPANTDATPGTVATAEVDTTLMPDWQPGAEIVVLQDQPLPLTILGVVLEISLGGG